MMKNGHPLRLGGVTGVCDLLEKWSVMNVQVLPNAASVDDDGGDPPPYEVRISKVGDHKRAFALEPVFWSILRRSSSQVVHASGRLCFTFADGFAIGGNNSSLLRSRAAEWASEQAEQLKDKGLVGLSRRITVSHTAPAFVIDQHRHVIASNKQFEDLVTGSSSVSTPGAPCGHGCPARRSHERTGQDPARAAGESFSVRISPSDGAKIERSGALNVMLVGEEKDRVLFSASCGPSRKRDAAPEFGRDQRSRRQRGEQQGPRDEQVRVAHHEAEPDARGGKHHAAQRPFCEFLS